MFKKSISILLAVLFCMTFTACNKKKNIESKPESELISESKTQSQVNSESSSQSSSELNLDSEIIVSGDSAIGFCQLGSESGWRDSQSESIKNEAVKRDMELVFTDAKQSHDRQVAYVRALIKKGVKIIALVPVSEDGWEDVLKEAKNAGISVIIIDKKINLADDSLYETLISPDFYAEGKKAAAELADSMDNEGNVIVIEGSTDNMTKERQKGFKEEIEKNYKNIKTVDSKIGDYNRDNGKLAMQELLNKHEDIDGIFAHNDDMALGAIEAIKEKNKKPAEDIKIVSVDATRAAFEAMTAGELNATIEYNPLIGSEFLDVCQRILDSKTVEKWVIQDETVFKMDTASKDMENRKY